MKVVVGLGNPGAKYAHTRHNVGFDVLSRLATRLNAGAAQAKFEAECVDVRIGDEPVLLAAPQTYMNCSGRAVRRIVDFYQLPLDHVLIVCDDIHLDLGRLRFRKSGSAGGQKGLADILRHLGTQDVARLRIGIGQPPGRMAATDFVLSRFRSDEQEAVENALERAADGVETWVAQGIDAAMNRFNAAAEG
jgi:PTH1 family peptidyl-tRNA hydrolase